MSSESLMRRIAGIEVAVQVGIRRVEEEEKEEEERRALLPLLPPLAAAAAAAATVAAATVRIPTLSQKSAEGKSFASSGP